MGEKKSKREMKRIIYITSVKGKKHNERITSEERGGKDGEGSQTKTKDKENKEQHHYLKRDIYRERIERERKSTE